MKIDLSPGTIISRNENVFSSEIDNEVVLMNADSGSYYGFDDIVSLIWNIIEEPKTIKEICDKLMEVYHIDYETCLKDVTELLENLIKEECITCDTKN